MFNDHNQLHTPVSRRRFLSTAAVGAATVTGATTLFTPGTAKPAHAASATTLTVMYAAGEFTPAYIAEFEQMYPGVKIRFLNADTTTFNAMVAAGKPPDVYRNGGFGSAAGNIQGINEDLTPYLKTSTVLHAADLEPVNDLFRWDGKRQGQGPLYGLVKDWSLDDTLWYNKKALQAAGYKGPGENESLDLNELLSMGKKLTIRKNGQVVQYGLDMAWGWAQHYEWLLVMAQAAGSSLFSPDLKKANFTSPEVLKALQWFVDYTKAGVGTSPLQTDATSPTGPFVAGRTALTTVGYWFGQQIETDPHKLSTTMINSPAPNWAGTRISPCTAGIGISMTAASKNKELAWKLIEYFIGGKPAMDRVTGGWGLASLKHLFPMLPHTTAFDQERLRVTQNDLKHFKTLLVTPYAQYGDVATAITTAVLNVSKGTATLPNAAKTLETAVNKLIQQGLQQV